jgi:mono/diheme cytochrome c family protein
MSATSLAPLPPVPAWSLGALVGFAIITAWAWASWSSSPRTTPLPIGPESAVAGDAAAPAADLPGLQLTCTAAGGATDVRLARVAALQVAAGSAPTPFLAPGPFTAVFEGALVLDAWNQVTFSAAGLGSAELQINDRVALTWSAQTPAVGVGIRLEKGRSRFRLTYHSQADGAGNFRLFWASSEFPREPVPSTVFVHPSGDAALALATSLRHGRALIGDLRCTHCHATTASAATGLPELEADAPDLRTIGARRQRAHLAAWILDPQAHRAHAAMPRLLSGADAAAQAADIAAYLASLGTPAPPPAFTPVEVAAGARHFAEIGCLACHGAKDGEAAPVALDAVAATWQPAALVEFLQHPAQHYRWNPMPTFALSADEARSLAAYLLAQPAPDRAQPLAGDAARGKTLVTTTRCTACHALDAAPATPAKPLSALHGAGEVGCLARTPEARQGAPDYALTAEDRTALVAFLATDLSALGRRTASEFASRRIAALRCTGCHERDGTDARISGLAPEIEALLAANPEPEPAAGAEHAEVSSAAGNPCPSLTVVGDKLRPAWMARLFAGTLPYRARPWLTKRMPAFPAESALLAQGLAEEHGLPGPEVPSAPAAATAVIGRQLVGSEGGLSCGACHGLGSLPPVAVFEAPGVNLGYAVERLQPDFFQRWMLAPQRFDAATRMPKFVGDDGTMPLKDILDGKADAQFAAIWRYLAELNHQTDFTH